ncbi:hypothetical protein PFZ59_09360 [Streptococcus suis]|uniref:hypothetical protein n=1 Tax=Streptococcus suis TaxID=1307 RepID=UPI00240E9A34|nr:hypothetical protein [Streptococcus suis]WFA75361.1 hypothetical protein PFZ59_09360 [Streptococcus suis]
MTAEISILNKHGIVLAADSAVTVNFGKGQAKTYNAVNKLFSLGENHDIGIMIYGNAEYMNIPWEVIIKEFRKEQRSHSFLKLNDCAESFIEFLKDPRFINEQISKRLIYSIIQDLLQLLLEFSSNRVNTLQAEDQEHPVSYEQIFEIVAGIIRENSNKENDLILLHDLSKEKFIEVYSGFCQSIIDDSIFLPKELLEQLYLPFIELSYQIVVSKNIFDSISGIVIAGYGNAELFPSLISYEISYLIDGEIKMLQTNESIVDLNNSDAAIVPFAQSDMISTILTGMDPLLKEAISESIIGLGNLNEGDKLKIIDSIAEQQKKHFIEPILGVVRTLALPELANMAETLVNLTSFKRHISDSLETVGGPVDVLVISKGDGPIWISRKEYFDISKNIEYYNRKRR